MEVIIRGVEGIDIPKVKRWADRFKMEKEIENNVKKKLGLKKTDLVYCEFNYSYPKEE